MPESLSLFSNLLELFLNVLEFLALIVSIITFFYLMFNKFSMALKKILAPCGLGFFLRIKVLFLCRKSAVKKRAFIEFAMLKTQGYSEISPEWKRIINEFKSFYSETQSNLVYTLPNCTLLIGEDFSRIVGQYFTFFSEESAKKAFGIKDGKLGWVIKLHIEEAYATPTFLLTGLLSKYEENWADFIKRYVSTAYMSEDKEERSAEVLSNELYLTFAWLLWGPSYELNYENSWSGLCQLSFGDESNSIPAIAPPNGAIATRIANRFKNNKGKRYGALLSVDLSVFQNKTFFQEFRQNVSPEYLYYYDKLENGDTSFALQIDDFVPFGGYKAKKYYCTAYVWILFELENRKSSDFRPETSLAFFEHSNLTDKYTYRFLVDMLIQKSISHFERIFAEDSLKAREYRFVCAMNTEIAKEFKKAYRERANRGDELAKQFEERIHIEPKRSPADAFLAFDEFFATGSPLEYCEVKPGNKRSIVDLGVFYADIYLDCFPDENERETFNNLLVYLENARDAKDYAYHIVLAKDEHGEIVAGAVFDYFARSNSGVIEFIAVKKKVQSAGYGTRLYDRVLSILENDAFCHNHRKLSYVFCEIDSPEYSKADVKKYMYFWHKHMYRHIEMHYVQPSLSVQQEPVTGLWLTAASPNQQIAELPGEQVISVIHDYLKYAMGIDEPEENADFQRMKKELEQKPNVRLSPIL